MGKVNNNKYKVDGKIYELPQHGLARTSEFKLSDKTKDYITFELRYSEDTLKVYPFKFSLQSKYTIGDNYVDIEYTVENLDDKEMYFSIGSHPAFLCNLDNDKKSYLKFEKSEVAGITKLNKEGCLIREKQPYLNGDRIELTKDIFKNDALIFDHLNSNKVSINCSSDNRYVTINYSGFPYLGVWSPKNDANFVCIEPWYGHADYEEFQGELKEKEGILTLQVNEKFKCNFTVSI